MRKVRPLNAPLLYNNYCTKRRCWANNSVVFRIVKSSVMQVEVSIVAVGGLSAYICRVRRDGFWAVFCRKKRRVGCDVLDMGGPVAPAEAFAAIRCLLNRFTARA